MATELADIANNSGLKLGGLGDQLDASGQVTQAQLDANTGRVEQAINTKWPIIRKRVIKQFAAEKSPFPETQKFADLGDDLKRDDVGITSITGTTTVTVVTDDDHDKVTGDTVFLADITGDGGITALNGTTKTVTVVSTTSFTLDSTTGLAAWDHTAGSGIVSKCPELGPWNYAFNLPSDYFALVRQTDELNYNQGGVRRTYQSGLILNIDGDGFLFVTNSLTNCNGDSAYIEYTIDQATFAIFSTQYEECLAMMLAYEISPMVGKNTEFRQQLLIEYGRVTVPKAKRDNESQSDKTSHYVAPYNGERGLSVETVRRGSRLGTYIAADGTRKSI